MAKAKRANMPTVAPLDLLDADVAVKKSKTPAFHLPEHQAKCDRLAALKLSRKTEEAEENMIKAELYAIGEGLQAPRYYEYVADLAPKEQVGTYMGFAFLPVAIGTFVSGAIAGPLVERYVGVRQDGVFTPGPDFANAGRMWFWVGGIGVVATCAMLAYDRLVVKRR